MDKTNEPSPEMPLFDFIVVFYMASPHGHRKDSPRRHTLIKLKRCCSALKAVLGRSPRVEDLSEPNADAMAAYLRDVKKYSDGGIKRLGQTLVAVWRYAFDMGIVLLPYPLRRAKRGVYKHPQDNKDVFPLSDSPLTLWGICQREYFPKNLRLRSEKTKSDYRYALRALGSFLGRQPVLSDLNDDTITEWTKKMLDGKCSVYSIRERMGRVLSLWNWCAKRRMVEHFPTITRPPAPDPVPFALTQKQVAALFEAADEERGLIEGIKARLWWRAFLGFVYVTAERRGAALSLRWADVDLDTGVAQIPAKYRKGRLKHATYHLPAEVVEMLRRIQQPTRELVFPWPYSEGKYFHNFGRIAERAGLPNNAKTKTHCLRATHATIKTVLGGDASKALMHSDNATTRKHYIDARHLPPDTTRVPIPWEQTVEALPTPELDAMAFI
jgi:integrase